MADTKPARSHHDNGNRHKMAVQQFFKDNRQKQKEERETQSALEREMRSSWLLCLEMDEYNLCDDRDIEKAAREQFKHDVETGSGDLSILWD
jgi:hypothetical protein